MSSGRADSHLARLMALLLDHPALVLAGRRLGAELGLGPSAVWALIEQLRGYGVSIEGHPGAGYRLRSEPDLLLPDLVRPHLRTHVFGHRLQHFFRTGSTQQLALAAAAAGAAEGLVVVAEEQTAGRGRHGHRWESAAGAGIYASLLLRPPGPPAGLLPLTLAAGLAIADAVRATAGAECELRWPNDLLLGGRKFCGLLLEMSAEATRIQHAVLGFGVNLLPQALPPELAEIATWIAAHTAAPPARVPLLAAILACLEDRYAQFKAGGSPALLREFEARCANARGLDVRVGADGLEGRTEGLDDNGFLRLRLASGELRIVVNGDVRPRAPG